MILDLGVGDLCEPLTGRTWPGPSIPRLCANRMAYYASHPAHVQRKVNRRDVAERCAGLEPIDLRRVRRQVFGQSELSGAAGMGGLDA